MFSSRTAAALSFIVCLDVGVVLSAPCGWTATPDKANQRYGKHEQSKRTNNQSQHLGEKGDIRELHRVGG